jgi:hypothetical protein
LGSFATSAAPNVPFVIRARESPRSLSISKYMNVNSLLYSARLPTRVTNGRLEASAHRPLGSWSESPPGASTRRACSILSRLAPGPSNGPIASEIAPAPLQPAALASLCQCLRLVVAADIPATIENLGVAFCNAAVKIQELRVEIAGRFRLEREMMVAVFAPHEGGAVLARDLGHARRDIADCETNTPVCSMGSAAIRGRRLCGPTSTTRRLPRVTPVYTLLPCHPRPPFQPSRSSRVSIWRSFMLIRGCSGGPPRKLTWSGISESARLPCTRWYSL